MKGIDNMEEYLKKIKETLEKNEEKVCENLKNIKIDDNVKSLEVQIFFDYGSISIVGYTMINENNDNGTCVILDDEDLSNVEAKESEFASIENENKLYDGIRQLVIELFEKNINLLKIPTYIMMHDSDERIYVKK